jgi:hypothetical protein
MDIFLGGQNQNCYNLFGVRPWLDRAHYFVFVDTVRSNSNAKEAVTSFLLARYSTRQICHWPNNFGKLAGAASSRE